MAYLLVHVVQVYDVITHQITSETTRKRQLLSLSDHLSYNFDIVGVIICIINNQHQRETKNLIHPKRKHFLHEPFKVRKNTIK